MADAIDDLEQALSRAVNPEILPSLYQAIDQWRQHHGGCRAYIARHSISRRHQAILSLAQTGLNQCEIARAVGVSHDTVRRVASKRSSYL